MNPVCIQSFMSIGIMVIDFNNKKKGNGNETEHKLIISIFGVQSSFDISYAVESVKVKPRKLN